MGVGSKVISFTSKIWPVTAILTVVSGTFLLLVYSVASSDYGMFAPCTPDVPRCTTDLILIHATEAIALLSLAIFVLGLFLNRRKKGALHLSLLMVLIMLLAFLFNLYRLA